MSFNFQKQKEVGDKGEKFLLESYHSLPLQKVEFKSPIGDFFRPDGKLVEVKTDTYPLERTPNFFMEYYSDRDKKKLGGPWRAYEQGADIFLYLYISNKVYYEFEDTRLLVQRLDRIIKKEKLKPIGIPNRGWVTNGYKIAREWLEELWVEHKVE